MNNNVVLIGRINNDVEKIEMDDKTIYKLILNISRNFKNKDGIYETDLIPIEIINNVGKAVFDYCNRNDLIAVKGRIENKDNALKIIAERISFLSTNKNLVNQN